MTPDADYVLRTARERSIRFVRLWFTDVLGTLKSIAIPVSELESALDEGVSLDGSALEGRERREERDVIAFPDPTSFQIVPWRTEAAVARMFCDLRTPEGQPSPADGRHVLRRTLAYAADQGYAFMVGSEIEFFLFEPPRNGGPPVPLDDGAYFDLTPLDAGSDFRRRTIEYLETMGIPVKASHHEAGPSQHEVDLEHTDALSMADAIVTFRIAVKEVAQESGVFATFMPKPLEGHFGSGMHLHLSLMGGERNLFHAQDGDAPMSELGKAFLAGVLAHARELSAITNQWTNSYKRLVPGFEAPLTVSWTRNGSSALVRVPANRPQRESATRVELRSPDPGANPYLALACVLGAGLRGIERDYQLQHEDSSRGELPNDLREAVDALDGSELVRDVLGERLTEAFLRNKRAELAAHRAQVTELERKTLLRVL
jgi:glutamine synthetase